MDLLPADDDIVLVPAAPLHRPGEPPQLDVELRQLAGTGEPVALVFTAVEALVRTLGPNQPWVAVPMAALADRLRDGGVTHIQIDPQYHEHIWQWSAADVEQAAGEQ